MPVIGDCFFSPWYGIGFYIDKADSKEKKISVHRIFLLKTKQIGHFSNLSLAFHFRPVTKLSSELDFQCIR